MDNKAIKKLEADLWESADLLRSGSKLTSQQYCMPVLGLIFLRYAYSRFKLVEAEVLKSRPVRGGKPLPVEASDFLEKSALFLPREAQYSYLVALPENVASAGLRTAGGQPINSLGEAVNYAMELIEAQSEQLVGVLPKEYTIFPDALLAELLRIFNNSALDEVGGDIIGRIYEYFLNKFAKNIASDDGVFFTPKSLVKMIVNVIEPASGVLLDCACGSGGMFVQTGDFVDRAGMSANRTMTFYGQEKVEYNAQLCLMNMAVHGLTGVIKSGDEANTFYHDAHGLAGRCDYVMANPPFNVDKVKAEAAAGAGRLPFGMPGVNKEKEVSNANYLWISYFYAYLNETGRAGFVMASSATDSQGKDKDIREKLIRTGHVDVMVSVANNFFYTKSLPCSLWFFDKAKREHIRDKVLFIDARNYYTVVDRTLNEWSEWQLKNLNAIVWLHRGETEKYTALLEEYKTAAAEYLRAVSAFDEAYFEHLPSDYVPELSKACEDVEKLSAEEISLDRFEEFIKCVDETGAVIKAFTSSVIGTFSDMKKDKYKEIRQWFEKEYGVKSEPLPAFKKAMQRIADEQLEYIAEARKAFEEALWLHGKFGDGTYADVPGLCRAADIAEIEQKGWSLTPGAYVGVAPTEDDGVDFADRMREIHSELLSLQEESDKLMETISRNMKEMGL